MSNATLAGEVEMEQPSILQDNLAHTDNNSLPKRSNTKFEEPPELEQALVELLQQEPVVLALPELAVPRSWEFPPMAQDRQLRRL